MSHVAQYQCSLTKVDLVILKKVLDFLAKKLNGKVVDKIKDYYGNEVKEWEGKKLIGAITTPNVPKGIGIIANDDNTISFVGDSYRCSQDFNELRKNIEFTYKQMALVIKMVEKGARVVEIKEIDNDKVYIKLEV